MSDPYWPWWAVITFFVGGGLTGFMITIFFWSNRVICPMCEHSVRADRFRDHWKECAF